MSDVAFDMISFYFLVAFVLMSAVYTLLDLAFYWGFLPNKISKYFKKKRMKIFDEWLVESALINSIPRIKNSLLRESILPTEMSNNYRINLEQMVARFTEKRKILIGKTENRLITRFVNLRGACLLPIVRDRASKIMVEFIKHEMTCDQDLHFDAIAVLKETNPFLGYRCAELLGVPCICLNRTSFGQGKEGDLLIDMYGLEHENSVIIIDDSVTTGYHFLKAVKTLREKGFQVNHGFFLFIRNEASAFEGLEQAGIRSHSPLKLDDEEIDSLIKKHKTYLDKTKSISFMVGN